MAQAKSPFVTTPQVFKDGGFPPHIFFRRDAPSSITDSLKHTIPEAPSPSGPHISSGGNAMNKPDHHVNDNQIIIHNAPTPVYYEHAVQHEAGSYINDTGALTTVSYAKTGRSPKDKRIVEEADSKDDIWWGPVNIPLEMDSFLSNRERALDYLDMQDTLYIVDAYAGWDPEHQKKIRIVATRAYHALFMRNMLICPTKEQLETFGEPDFVIYNAGMFPANRYTTGVTSETSVNLCLGRKEMVILGTQYAGEMKKGVLTLMFFLAPRSNTLCLHSSATESLEVDPKLGKKTSTVFFGLSGTGKTTLSADPNRALIGDDEHVWTDSGLYNVEGGCYAKCVKLNKDAEPDIYNAIKFGAIVENVQMESDRSIDYDSTALTMNTRCAYPLTHIPNSKFPAVTSDHPTSVVLLTCDAFGVLPPVSRLTIPQVMFQFISGYTAKMPGVEAGDDEVSATFSPCFGGPFLMYHPAHYAEQLAKKLHEHSATAYLVNTGWVNGEYIKPGTDASGKKEGRRCPIRITRAIVNAINSGALAGDDVPMKTLPGFGFQVPQTIPGVNEADSAVLYPPTAWGDEAAWKAKCNVLVDKFNTNMKTYISSVKSADTQTEILSASPKAL